ncbi:MAG: hypothetical protein LDL41_08215 [Coleofasciculus sp. S288]|nr:hypothetical protein [Coleofasciculus sp. S288]
MPGYFPSSCISCFRNWWKTCATLVKANLEETGNLSSNAENPYPIAL